MKESLTSEESSMYFPLVTKIKCFAKISLNINNDQLGKHIPYFTIYRAITITYPNKEFD